MALYRRHAQFSILHDVWYSYEPFHCEEGVSEGEPQFADIYKKVRRHLFLRGGCVAEGEPQFADIYKKVGTFCLRGLACY